MHLAILRNDGYKKGFEKFEWGIKNLVKVWKCVYGYLNQSLVWWMTSFDETINKQDVTTSKPIKNDRYVYAYAYFSNMQHT